ncbi:MAG: hypothetical protein QOH93_1866 [Chloroflexia bacterium]|nr:hypothetical protein [Chloroflexia bacterium]
MLVIPCLLLACNPSGETSPVSSKVEPTTLASIEMKQLAIQDSSTLGITPETSIQLGGTPVTTQAEIRLNPDRGGAGKQVSIVGNNFPPDADVQIYLGGLNTGASEHVYATLRSGGDGSVRGTFEMPGYWPNGEKILVSQVTVLAATPDFLHKAAAEFNYEAASTEPDDNTPK